MTARAETGALGRLGRWWSDRRRRRVVEGVEECAVDRSLLAWADRDPGVLELNRRDLERRESGLLRRAVDLGCEREALAALHPESTASARRHGGESAALLLVNLEGLDPGDAYSVELPSGRSIKVRVTAEDAAWSFAFEAPSGVSVYNLTHEVACAAARRILNPESVLVGDKGGGDDA